MGNKLSSISFINIKSIKLISSNKNNYKYLITNDDNKTENIALNSKENDKFQMRYKWSQEFKPLIGLDYYKMLSIEKYNKIKTNDGFIYNISILYNTNDMRDFTFTKNQMDWFLKYIHEISPSGKQIILEFNKKFLLL
jgi:hypothetical protein